MEWCLNGCVDDGSDGNGDSNQEAADDFRSCSARIEKRKMRREV